MRHILLFFVALCFLWKATTAGTIKHFTVLDNDDNVQKIFALSNAGQSLDMDHSKRLLHFDKHIAYKMNVCCFYGNILDFYVTDILDTDANLQNLLEVREMLHRFSQGLKERGCANVQDQLIEKFKQEFRKMGNPNGLHKAVGELSSLIYNLQLYC